MLYGTYIVAGVLAFCLLLWPEHTVNRLALLGIEIQLAWANVLLQYKAWKLHRSLVKFAKANDFPPPGPFRFVNIHERDDKF